MKRLMMMLVVAAAFPALAQTPVTAPATTPATPPPYDAGGLPRLPVYGSVEGQPVDSRVPEKKADTRQFPQQTRAPYHPSPCFSMAANSSAVKTPSQATIAPDRMGDVPNARLPVTCPPGLVFCCCD